MRVILVGLTLITGLGADIKFYRERVDIIIDNASGVVEGNFFLTNTSPVRLTPLIFFPFPIDQDHPYPETIAVEEYNYQICDSGIAIIIPFEPNEKKRLKLRYRQKIFDQVFTYIVRTIHEWKRPVAEAEFVIVLPASFKNPEINYKVNLVRKDSLRLIYKIKRKNFYPRDDLQIKWQVE
ncbi:MAG: hypothetical protein ABIL05_04475 [candidate division WOR-3 bacterium]